VSQSMRGFFLAFILFPMTPGASEKDKVAHRAAAPTIGQAPLRPFSFAVVRRGIMETPWRISDEKNRLTVPSCLVY